MNNISAYIEHTLLKQTASQTQVEQLCTEAIEHDFVGVCVPPTWVTYSKALLAGSNVKLVTVLGFPFGYNNTEGKVAEAKQSIADGADELDMVINVSFLKAGKYNAVGEELKKLSDIAHRSGVMLKVIVESGILSDDELKKACDLCIDANVDFVKTSTGFAEVGATVEAVRIMRSELPEHIKIKASGGIRDKEFALALIDAGADRLGTSSGVKLVQE